MFGRSSLFGTTSKTIKMKRTVKYIILAAAICLSAACAKDEPAGTRSGERQTPLSISVTDAGYLSGSGVSPTRAVENGYATEFEAGDACGLFVVRNGMVMEANVKLTAYDDGAGGIVWEPEYEVLHAKGNIYHLYYPWTETPENTPGTGDALNTGSEEGFFSGMIEAWRPVADQSDYKTGYAASDLMTAQAQADMSSDVARLSFTLTHNMALAVVEAPGSVNSGSGGRSSIRFDESSVPYDFDGAYRYIVNPAAGATVLCYCEREDGLLYEYAIRIEAGELAGGIYRIYELAGTADVKSVGLDLQ